MIPTWELGMWMGFWMIFGHVVADFALQSDTMAVEKNRHLNDGKKGVPWYYWMWAHSLIHGGLVAIITHSAILGLAEMVCHAVLDILKCEKLTNIHVDQLGHVLCKVVWILIVLGVIG